MGALIQESDGNCRDGSEIPFPEVLIRKGTENGQGEWWDGRWAVPRVPRELEQVEPIVRFFILIVTISISVIL